MAAWDQSKFDAVLEEYLSKTHKRTLPEIINTKAYFVAVRATTTTRKTDPGAIDRSLGRIVTVERLSKAGKTVKSRQLQLTAGDQADAPLAALMVNARRGKEGLPGLYGPEMEKAIRLLIARRRSSIGFIRSGWLPAIHKLDSHADKRGAPRPEAGKQFGHDKGTAEPAEPNWNLLCTIINEARSQSDRGLFDKFGNEGLNHAMAQEMADMQRWMEERLKPDAEEFTHKAA